MVKATLVILRHGQTEDNIKRLNTGQNETPLTKTGEEQSRMAGTLIRDVHFDKVYSSPLSRAFNTAVLALKASGTQQHLQNDDGSWQIEKRKEIIEVNDGDLTGRSLVDDPVLDEYFKHSVYDVPAPGGESDKQLVARIKKFYEEEVLPRLAHGENVLVTSHSGAICAFDIAMGLSPVPADGTPWKTRKKIPNAGPAVFEYEDGVLKKSYAIENPETVKASMKKKLDAEKHRPPKA
jgi:2,3-bisphosphoglycerate-dependent phosphoglycerate mutase